jgi:exosortase
MSEIANSPVAEVIPNKALGSIPSWAVGHGVLLLLQLPLIARYFYDLFQITHYQFYPFAILLFVFLVYKRWDLTAEPKSIWWVRFSRVWLVLAFLIQVLATLVFSPSLMWLAALLLLLSFAMRCIDVETGASLISSWLVIAITYRLPVNLDQRMISWLQLVSTNFASAVMDLMGTTHYSSGTVVHLESRSLFIAEACSGVQSLFTVLFFSVAISVLFRRNWGNTILLILTSVFWAGVMNVFRITAIGFADSSFQIDLSEGTSHQILGYFVLVIALGLLLSTDQLLLFLFGRIYFDDTEQNSFLSKGFPRWFRLGRDRHAVETTPLQPNVSFDRGLIVTGILISVVAGSFATWKLVGNMSISKLRRTSQVALEESNLVLPPPIKIQKYYRQDRDEHSEFGQHSDIWEIGIGDLTGVVSFDRPFFVWHELTMCYRSVGWEKNGANWRAVLFHGDEKRWPMVEATFVNAIGQRGYLLFSLFDLDANPLSPADTLYSDSGLIASLFNRLKVDYGAQTVSYQCQFWIVTNRELTEEERLAARDVHAQSRELFRQNFIQSAKAR